jgi:hypothetical protein
LPCQGQHPHASSPLQSFGSFDLQLKLPGWVLAGATESPSAALFRAKECWEGRGPRALCPYSSSAMQKPGELVRELNRAEGRASSPSSRPSAVGVLRARIGGGTGGRPLENSACEKQYFALHKRASRRAGKTNSCARNSKHEPRPSLPALRFGPNEFSVAGSFDDSL